MKITGSCNGKNYTIDVPISELEYDMMVIEHYRKHSFDLENPENPGLNWAIFSLAIMDRYAGGKDFKEIDSNILEKSWPLKYNAFHSAKQNTSNQFHLSCHMAKIFQKHLDKTAEQVKAELLDLLWNNSKNEETRINKYKDLYTDIKCSNSLLEQDYETCHKQIVELTDIVSDLENQINKTAEQVKSELRKEFLPKTQDEEAHVSIYNDLYTDIKTVDSLSKDKYEQCQTQINELINTLSILQKKTDILAAPQSMEWLDTLLTVINLIVTYIIAFQMIYLLYTFPDSTKNPIIQYARNLIYPTYPNFLGYIE